MSYRVKWLFTPPLALVVWYACLLLVPSFGSTSVAQMLRASFSDLLLCVLMLIPFSRLLGAKMSSFWPAGSWGKLGKALFAMFVTGTLIELLAWLAFPSSRTFSLETGSAIWSFPTSLVLVVCAALLEELAFRQWFLLFDQPSEDGTFCKSGLPKRLALCLASAALFTVFHFGNPELSVSFLVASLYYFIMGFALMAIAFGTGSIAASLGIHIANNLVSAWVCGYNGSVIETNTLIKNNSGLSGLVIIQLCICLLACCMALKGEFTNGIRQAEIKN